MQLVPRVDTDRVAAHVVSRPAHAEIVRSERFIILVEAFVGVVLGVCPCPRMRTVRRIVLPGLASQAKGSS